VIGRRRLTVIGAWLYKRHITTKIMFIEISGYCR
jgi:hypothetical protein